MFGFGNKAKDAPKSHTLVQKEGDAEPHPDESEPLTQQQFKRGEYLVHILIEQTRGLSNPSDSDRTIDPLVQVQCMGQTRFSKLKSGAGTGTTLWNEHMHFTKRYDDGRALQGEQIKLTVLNHKYFGANANIGVYEIDFSTIYMLEQHALMHKWLGLVNPQKDFNKLTGFLKVSINIVGEGDKQIPLEMENELTSNKSTDQQMLFSDGDLLLPPHIQTESQLLTITLGRGEGLMKMDTIGTIDPYLVFECGASSIRTETIESNQNPVWEMVLHLPLMAPCVSDSVMLKLYDYDRGRNDEIVGSQQFKIEDIKQGLYKSPFWINVYGANIGADTEQRKFLCSHPELGTQYAGRLLLKLEISDAESPEQSINPIVDKATLSDLRMKTLTSWDLIGDVFYVMNCPKEDGHYAVMISWGEVISTTPINKAKNGLCEYYVTQMLKNIQFPYRSSKELPDLFLYLVDHEVPICLKRLKVIEVFAVGDSKLGVSFVKPLLPDISIRDTDIDKSGTLKIRLCLQPSGAPIPPRQLQPPKVTNSRLFINLFQAQQLVPSDMGGLADPLCEVIFYDQKAESVLVNNSLSPIWNQQIILPVPTFSSESMPPVVLRFFDQDKVSRDFMGHCLLSFDDLVKSNQLRVNTLELAQPQWTKISLLGQEAGMVLVSFNYFDQDPRNQFSNQIAPKVGKYYVRIKALGLRHLKSFGLLPVTKAFIKFNLNSIRRPEDKSARGEIMTQPKEPGANPNIQTIIAFDILLPQDSIYMPTLQCTVHDYVMKGLVQPTIGNFQVDLHTFQKNTINRINNQLALAQKAVMDLGLSADDAIHLDKDYGVASIPEKKQEDDPQGQVEIKAAPIVKKKARDENCSHDESEEVIEVMKQYGILEHDLLRSDHIIKYVQYDRNPDDGTWTEIEKFPEEYFIGLGFDTQQHKSDLLILRQQLQADKNPGNAIKLNSTAQRRLDKEMASQNKQALLDRAQKDHSAKGIIHQVQQKRLLQIGQEEEKKQAPADNKDVELLIPATDAKVQVELSEKSNKHYRFCVPFPLEESLFMTRHTFDELELHKGIENKKAGSSFADIVFGMGEKNHKVGLFKGWIDIISEAQHAQFKANPASKLIPQILEFKPGKTKTNDWDKELISKSPVIVRVYILDAFNLPSKDENSDSDPFLVVTLGNLRQDNKHEYKSDTCNPQFFKMFQFSTELPGASDLTIQVMDYDLIKPNELLGQTVIDIEDRYFQKRWRQLQQVPIETRQLYHPSSSLSQGVIRLFVEIISSKVQTILRNPWSIEPRPPMKFELRVVVWDVFDAPAKDSEDTSDLYVVGYLDESTKQKTDTHYRAQGGHGSFNWRMVFPVTLPAPEVLVSFQIFDKDIFTPDDFISDCTFDLTELASRAFENEINLKALGNKPPQTDGILGGTQFLLSRKSAKDGTMYEKIELVTENAEKPGYVGFKPQGKIVVSIELMPSSLQRFIPTILRSEQNPAGLGRSEPNHSPFCPTPTGRLEWSWNPLVMMRQMLGPKARLVLCWMSFLLLISYLIVMYFPVISGDIIANAIVSK